MEKKYMMTEKTLTLEDGTVLHRIRALKDFGNVEKGMLGGWIEKEENLSHFDRCWIYNDAKVYGDAEVRNDAKIFGFAKVFGNAVVCDDANVFDDAQVSGNSSISGYAKVSHNADILSTSDILCVGPLDIKGTYITSYKDKNGIIKISGNTNLGDINMETEILTLHKFEEIILNTPDFLSIEELKNYINAIDFMKAKWN